MRSIILVSAFVGVVLSAPLSTSICNSNKMTITEVSKRAPVIVKATVLAHNPTVYKTDAKGEPTLVVVNTDVVVESVAKNEDGPCIPALFTLGEVVLKDRCKDIRKTFQVGFTYFMMVRIDGGAVFAVDGQTNFYIANQFNEKLIRDTTKCMDQTSCGSFLCDTPRQTLDLTTDLNQEQEEATTNATNGDEVQQEVVTVGPEFTTEEPEFTTGEPEFTTEEPGFTTTEEPEFTTEEPEWTTREPEFTTEEPEFTTEEPEFTNEEPELTTGEPEFTTEEPEFTTEEPEFTNEEPELTTGEPEFTTEEPEFTTEEPELTTGEPEFTTEEPEITTEDPDNTNSNTTITTDGPTVTAEDPMVSTGEPVTTTDTIGDNQFISTTELPTTTGSDIGDERAELGQDWETIMPESQEETIQSDESSEEIGNEPMMNQDGDDLIIRESEEQSIDEEPIFENGEDGSNTDIDGLSDDDFESVAEDEEQDGLSDDEDLDSSDNIELREEDGESDAMADESNGPVNELVLDEFTDSDEEEVDADGQSLGSSNRHSKSSSASDEDDNEMDVLNDERDIIDDEVEDLIEDEEADEDEIDNLEEEEDELAAEQEEWLASDEIQITTPAEELTTVSEDEVPRNQYAEAGPMVTDTGVTDGVEVQLSTSGVMDEATEAATTADVPMDPTTAKPEPSKKLIEGITENYKIKDESESKPFTVKL